MTRRARVRAIAVAVGVAVGTPAGVDAQARVRGAVHDSVGGVPLRDAIVQLVRDGDPLQSVTVRSDANGAFVFDAVVPATYVIGFLHPRLDSLLITAPMQRLVLRDGTDTTVTLAVPSRSTLVGAVCGDERSQTGTALFLGRVRRSSGAAEAIVGGVRASWISVSIDGTRISTEDRSSTARASADGAFAVCGLPEDGRFSVQAWIGADSSGTIELAMPPSGILVRDLYTAPRVATRDSGASSPSASPVAEVQRDQGQLRGIVRDTAGRPIAGARVGIRGNARASTTSLANGTFALQPIPLGTQTLEVRALGFQPRRLVIDVRLDAETELPIRLEPLGDVLAAVRVTASRGLAGFEARRERGRGVFLDEAAIARRDPMFIADIVRAVPGVVVRPSGSFSDLVQFRQPRRGLCSPTLFVDGVLRPYQASHLDALLSADDVRAVEVYLRVEDIPREFTAPPPQCGALVIWRGVRAPAVDR